MDEGYVSKTVLTATLLWLAVAKVLLWAWIVGLVWPDHGLIAVLLSASACCLAAFTGTLHNRIYAERVVRLIRLTSHLGSLTESERPELRSVGEDTRHRR